MSAALDRLPAILDASRGPPPDEAVETLAKTGSLYVIGRGATFAVAAEAALKLKETSAIHAEAFSSAEVLHGPAGVIGQGFPILCFAPADAARDGFFETVERLESFGAAPLVVDFAPHPRWPTFVAPDGGHALTTPVAALHAFYRLAEAVGAPPRPRPRPAAAPDEGDADGVAALGSSAATTKRRCAQRRRPPERPSERRGRGIRADPAGRRIRGSRCGACRRRRDGSRARRYFPSAGRHARISE